MYCFKTHKIEFFQTVSVLIHFYLKYRLLNFPETEADGYRNRSLHRVETENYVQLP